MNITTDIHSTNAVADRLRAEGTPFAVATVVRTLASTAAKPGMKALVLENGEFVDGWLGGGCVTAAVKKAAIKAIETGDAKLVCLRPEELMADMQDAAEDSQIHVARNGCPSKGSMDIFVEPVKPQPELLVCGSGPVALALLRIARSFGFSLAQSGSIENTLADKHYLTPEEMAGAHSLKIDRYAVIATQGKGDVAALNAMLNMDTNYIAFVGSRRKFSSYEDKLRAAGISDKDIASVRSPAGLHINAVTPDEIALSIMAEIIQTRRATRQQRESHDKK